MLRDRQHIGLHAIDLVGEHLPELAEPCLRLIVDQQRTTLAQFLTQSLEVLRRQFDNAAGTNNWFNNDRRRLSATMTVQGLHTEVQRCHAAALAVTLVGATVAVGRRNGDGCDHRYRRRGFRPPHRAHTGRARFQLARLKLREGGAAAGRVLRGAVRQTEGSRPEPRDTRRAAATSTTWHGSRSGVVSSLNARFRLQMHAMLFFFCSANEFVSKNPTINRCMTDRVGAYACRLPWGWRLERSLAEPQGFST